MSEEIKAKFCFKPLVVTGVMTIVLGLLFWLADYMFCCGTVRAAMGVMAAQMGEGFAKLFGLKCGFGNSLMSTNLSNSVFIQVPMLYIHYTKTRATIITAKMALLLQPRLLGTKRLSRSISPILRAHSRA